MNVQRKVWLPVLVVALIAFALAATAQAEEKAAKASATGTWKSKVERNGRTFETTYKLKQEGDKLTGTVSGARGRSTKIEDGTVKNGKVSFKVTVEFNGNKFTRTFTGEVKGNTIKGKVSFERDGEKQSRDWMATRAEEAK